MQVNARLPASIEFRLRGGLWVDWLSAGRICWRSWVTSAHELVNTGMRKKRNISNRAIQATTSNQSCFIFRPAHCSPVPPATCAANQTQ